MKKIYSKKIYLIGFIGIFIFSTFLTPATTAQELTYDGANTEQFPYHSMYPSEVYVYNLTWVTSGGLNILFANESYFKFEIAKGNESFYYHDNNLAGYAIWGDSYKMDATSGSLVYHGVDVQLAFWNESIPYVVNPVFESKFIPVNSSGSVSPFIFNKVADYYGSFYLNENRYPNLNSFHFWNTSSIYEKLNYTNDGILISYQAKYDDWAIIDFTLMSQPAQLAPEFSFTTEDGMLNIISPNIKLDVNITNADNNNDEVVDTDYLCRVLIDSAWSNWTTIPTLIDYDLSSIPSGTHQITLEVKNMYGITQEQITIQYTPPTDQGSIPGYSTLITVAVLLFSVSIILFSYRKKCR